MEDELINETQENESEQQLREEREHLKKGILHYLRNLFDIRGDMMSQSQIDEMMQENTVIHGSNMWILILAMLIACIGLYNDAPAIIIGAMLISPLMNGIITMGYSLGVRDLSMLGQAFKRFTTQVVISLVAASLFFSIARLDEPTAEMISRTSPTFWDVLIALFGGVAGMIGNTRQKKGNVIPGVAIATALMPPLCTAGYGIATWQLNIFFGALYLFLINALLIALAACIVTNLLKIPNRVQLDAKKRKKINFAVALISMFVTLTSITNNLYDVAGIRVICSFVDDIYLLADCLLQQDDIRLIEKKDYIKNPKPNGYRSLHLIVEIPIFLCDEKKYVKVEVQLRTIAMESWANLEHQMRYKKELKAELYEKTSEALLECAQTCYEIDMKMQEIRTQIELA